MADITVRVNGEDRPLPAGSTLTDLLHQLGLAGRRIAVERNGDIVPRSQHGDTPLSDRDRIEIVHAIGGG